MQREPGAVKHIAISGVRWTGLAQVARVGLLLLTTLVLAWLLAPSDFGLVGMAAVVVAFVALFRDLGMGAAVVHDKTLDEESISSIFWASVLIGVAAGGLLAGTAPLVADFYGEERLTPILRVLALSLPLSGVSVVPLSLLQRELRFPSIARVETYANAGGAVAGIGAALAGAGAWSLVAQALAVSALLAVLALRAAAFRPRMVLRPAAVRSVAGYGLALTGSQFSSWLTRNADQLLIGRYLGATELGYYALAGRIVLQPLQAASGVLARVMFPIYARIREDPARAGSAYLRVASAFAVFVFPALAGMVIVSAPLVGAFFGDRWSPAAPLIAIFALSGILIALGTMVGPIYQAMGRTDIMLRWSLAAGIVVVFAYVVGLRWGTVGVAAGYLVATLLLIYPLLATPLRLIGLRVPDLLRVLRRPALATAIMCILTVPLGLLLAGTVPPMAHLGLVVLAGIVTYAGGSLLVNGEQVRELAGLAVAGKRA